jgi:uridine phosphorylase
LFEKVEQVKHLPISFGQIARYVIVPGDPNRVPIISELLDDVQHQGKNREFNAARGKYKDVETILQINAIR